MSSTALNELFQKTKSQIKPDPDKKFINVDAILTILIFQGLRILLPEIKEWVKLGFSKVVFKRLEIEKRLKDYALEKELDYKKAEESCEKIAQNINEDNIKEIISELEKTK